MIVLMFLEEGVSGSSLLGAMCFFGTWAACFLFCYFFYGLKYHFQYHLTDKGIYYQSQEHVSERAYGMVRGMACVGIAVFLLAMMFMGPIALVGVGGGFCSLLNSPIFKNLSQ